MNLSEMTQQSLQVLAAPQNQTFQKVRSKGDAVDATLYMLVGIGLAVLFGAKGGWEDALTNFIISVVYYSVLCHGIYFVAHRLTRHTLWDPMAYTFSLFLVPLSVLISFGGLVLSFTPYWTLLIGPWMVFGVGLSLFYVGRCLRSLMQLQRPLHHLLLLGGAFGILLGILLLGFKLIGFF